MAVSENLSVFSSEIMEAIRYRVRIAMAVLLQSDNDSGIAIALKVIGINYPEPVIVVQNSSGEHSLLLTKYTLDESFEEDEEPLAGFLKRGELDFLSPEGHYNLLRCYKSWQKFKAATTQGFVPRHKFFYCGVLNKAFVLIDSGLKDEMMESVYPINLTKDEAFINLNPSNTIGYQLALNTSSKIGNLLTESSRIDHVKISSCKKMKLSENYEGRIIDKDFEDFSSRLLLLVNQASEREICSSLEQLLDSFVAQNSSDELLDTVFLKIVDWFVKSDGIFRNRNELVRLIRTESDRISVRHSYVKKEANEYQTYLKSLGVTYDERAVGDLRKAIFNTDINSVIHVKPVNNISTVLSAIKTSQALDDSEGEERLSLIIPGELLKNLTIFHDVDDLLSYLPRSLFLVIVCTEPSHNDILASLVVAYNRRVGDQSRRLSPMKFVVVATEFNAPISLVDIADTQVSWSHLTVESRQYQIKKPLVYNGCVTDLLKLTTEEVREFGWFNQAMLEEYLTTQQLEINSIVPSTVRKNEGFLPKTLRFLVEIDAEVSSFRNLANRLCYSKTDFEELCRIDPRQDIHRLEKFNDGSGERLFWRESRGSIRDLRPFIIRNSWSVFGTNDADFFGSEDIAVDNWINDRTRTVDILLNSVNSSLIERLARKNDDAQRLPPWLFFIDLNENFHTLNCFVKSQEFLQAKAADVLVNHLIMWPGGSHVAKKLFISRLMNPGGRVILAFEGFEKLNLDCWNKIIGVLETLKCMPGIERLVLFHTPDEYFSADLEDRLNQFAFFIPDPSQEDQIDYLVQYWSGKLESIANEESKVSLAKCAENVIKAVSPSAAIGTYRVRTNVTCRLLAEVAIENVKTIGNLDTMEFFQKSMAVPGIYDMLWKKKLACFQQSFGDESLMFVETVKAICQRIAIQNVVHPADVQTFWRRDSYFRLVGIQTLHRCAKAITEMGIFSETGCFQFIDRSIAEFFVAQYFYDCLQHEECPVFHTTTAQDVVLRSILIKSEYLGVRFFLNWLLEPHLRDLKFDTKTNERNPFINQTALNDRLVEIVLINNRKNSYAIFEQAVRDGHANILSWLLFCAHDSILRNGSFNSETIFNFFNVDNAAFLVSISDSSEGGYEIVKRLFAWFQMADGTYLKEFIRVVCLETFCCHPSAVMDFIACQLSKLDVEYLLNIFFNIDHCFITRLLESDSSVQLGYLEAVFSRLSDLFPTALAKVKPLILDWFSKLEPLANYSDVVPYLTAFLLDGTELEISKKMVSHAVRLCPALLEKLHWNKPTNPSDVRVALRERDFGGLNHVQRAALLAQSATIRQVLNDLRWLRAKKVSDAPNLIAAVTHDEHGATPMYLSAVRGHREPCELLLDFFNDVFTSDEITLLLTENKGCLFRALLDSVARQDEEAALSTLDAAERKLCSRALFNLLMRGLDGSRRGTLLVKALESQCVKVARKVCGIVSKRLGQQGLTDLMREENVFLVVYMLASCNETETLEAVLESVLTCKGDSFLVHQLLRGDDLKQRSLGSLQELVDIVSVLRNDAVRRYVPRRLGPSALSHFIHLLTIIVKINLSPIETTRASIWTLYCTRATDCLGHVDEILQSVADEICLGEATVNELAMHSPAFDDVPLVVKLKKMKADLIVEAFLRRSPRLILVLPNDPVHDVLLVEPSSSLSPLDEAMEAILTLTTDSLASDAEATGLDQTLLAE